MGEYIRTSYASHFIAQNSNVPIPADAEPLDEKSAERVGRLVAAAVALGHWEPLAEMLCRGTGPIHDDPLSVGRLVEYHVARGELRRAYDVLKKCRDEAERDERLRRRRETFVRVNGHCAPDLVELAEVVDDVRILGALESAGITTTEQLVEAGVDRVRSIPNLGVRMFERIVAGLDRALVRHSFG